jgi:hypothetical protein
MHDELFIGLRAGIGVWVVPLTFNRGRIVVGPLASSSYDDAW